MVIHCRREGDQDAGHTGRGQFGDTWIEIEPLPGGDAYALLLLSDVRHGPSCVERLENARGERAAVNFNFNGWGRKQPHARDATVAARMAELAGVPVFRNPPLARALYKATEVGQTIPAALYTAVAEILAFLMRLRSAPRGDRPAQ